MRSCHFDCSQLLQLLMKPLVLFCQSLTTPFEKLTIYFSLLKLCPADTHTEHIKKHCLRSSLSTSVCLSFVLQTDTHAAQKTNTVLRSSQCTSACFSLSYRQTDTDRRHKTQAPSEKLTIFFSLQITQRESICVPCSPVLEPDFHLTRSQVQLLRQCILLLLRKKLAQIESHKHVGGYPQNGGKNNSLSLSLRKFKRGNGRNWQEIVQSIPGWACYGLWSFLLVVRIVLWRDEASSWWRLFLLHLRHHYHHLLLSLDRKLFPALPSRTRRISYYSPAVWRLCCLETTTTQPRRIRWLKAIGSCRWWCRL